MLFIDGGMLQHEPGLHADNTALAIYREAEEARRVIAASPLRFNMGRVGEKNDMRGWKVEGQGGGLDEEVETRSMSEPDMEGGRADSLSQVPASAEEEAQAEFQEAAEPRVQYATSARGAVNFHRLTNTTTPASPSPTAKNTKPQPPRPSTQTSTPPPQKPASLPTPPPSSPAKPSPGPETKRREFYLEIERSGMNHHSYVQRQYYYDGWRLEERTLMADDLQGRVPVEGFREFDTGKGERALRVRLMRREREEGKRVALREMWERGREARGES